MGAAANDLPPLPYKTVARPHPLRQTAAVALRTLRRYGLRGTRLRALLCRLQLERERDSVVASWPTDGEDRAALEEISELAMKLHGRLRALSSRADAALDAGHRDAYPVAHYADLYRAKNLWPLVVASSRGAKALPSQSRRRSHPNIVEAINVFVAPLGIDPSVAVGSKFYKACAAAFELADITIDKQERKRRASPDGSIKAFMRDMVKTGPEK